ncbi:MAG: DUF4838 domain-containing protein, partial [Armatimonadetes bacterium]|nr:DUF4838 domain-containing protein [Armatimonadota bacterium]
MSRLLTRVARGSAPLVLLIASHCAAAPLAISADGRSEYAVVQAAGATEAESFAAQELAAFLRRGTGAEWPLAGEAGFGGGRAVYVGPTAFAAKHGLTPDELGPEEWVIRRFEGDLVLCGGRPRGTLYGVYEFLERFVGVRFLDPDTEFVPDRPTLRLPAGLAVRDAPVFSRREVFMVAPGQPKHTLFEVRRKVNSFGNAAVPAAGPELGYAFRFGGPYSTHTHHLYSEAFPPDKPEYFALTENGSRTGPGPQGQVCLSHPEVRKLFAARLRDYIRRDREEILGAGSLEPFPTVYALVPNDNLNKCVCPGCVALAEQYGAYSGAVIDFTNALAADIEPDYPEVRVAVAAYTYYLDLPRGIRPRDNVIVTLAQLGCEFRSPPLRDTLRAMTHPANAEPRRVLEAWAGISPALATHDYWTAWNQPFQWPHANVHGLAETLKLYQRCRMQHFFAEDELFGTRVHNFVDLQFYLATRLLQDPTQDAEPIIADFLEPYYGPAAPAMRQLLDYLERRQDEQPGGLAAVPPSARRYFDRGFFLETDVLLSEAERRVAGDPERLRRVQQERLAFDEAMLYLWPMLSADGGLPYAREQVIDRLRGQYEAACRKYGGWGEACRAADDARLDYLASMPP